MWSQINEKPVTKMDDEMQFKDWRESQMHVFSELKRLSSSIEKLGTAVSQMTTSHAEVKTEVRLRSSIWASISSAIVLACYALAKHFSGIK